jgi:hypothetical protein
MICGSWDCGLIFVPEYYECGEGEDGCKKHYLYYWDVDIGERKSATSYMIYANLDRNFIGIHAGAWINAGDWLSLIQVARGARTDRIAGSLPASSLRIEKVISRVKMWVPPPPGWVPTWQMPVWPPKMPWDFEDALELFEPFCIGPYGVNGEERTSCHTFVGGRCASGCTYNSILFCKDEFPAVMFYNPMDFYYAERMWFPMRPEPVDNEFNPYASHWGVRPLSFLPHEANMPIN